MEKPVNSVLFFDGYCGLCDAVVTRLMPWALEGKFRISSLQGESYKNVIARHPELKSVDSVVWVENFDRENETVSIRGKALVRILDTVGGWFRPFYYVLRIFPNRLLDSIYNWVARNRMKLFPPRDTCRLPSPEERAVFLP